MAAGLRRRWRTDSLPDYDVVTDQDIAIYTKHPIENVSWTELWYVNGDANRRYLTKN